MAIQQTQCDSFLYEVCSGTHVILTDIFKIALYVSSAAIGASTTVYTTTGEVSGGVYVAGGNALTGNALTTANGVTYINFDNSAWPVGIITARGALIYNSSKSNKAVAVLDFGMDKTSTSVTAFTVTMPANTSSTALLRLTTSVG